MSAVPGRLPGRATLTEDRLTLEIERLTPQGIVTTTFVRAASEPWTDADVREALAAVDDSRVMATVLPGQENQARRYRLPGRRWLYVHINTGPPTWWCPRIDPRGGALMVGWLRGLVAVAIKKEKSDDCPR